MFVVAALFAEKIMSSMTISGIVFACGFGGALIGMIMRAVLPEKHLSAESKDLVRLGMGLVATMTALVLGLMVASAKSSFDAQRSGLAQLSANIIVLDKTLARYGTETKEVRAILRAAVADVIEHTWTEETGPFGKTTLQSSTPVSYEGFYEKMQELKPANEQQRALHAQAMKVAGDIGQTRWLMYSQKTSSIPTPFLVVLVCWLTLIMASFGLFAPPNTVVFFTLLVCALTVSSAVYLILDLDQPFDGLIQISSAPLRNALEQRGK
jgi:hypothetical protein